MAKLYPFQEEGVKFLREHNSALLAALTSKFEIETFLREAKPLKGGDA